MHRKYLGLLILAVFAATPASAQTVTYPNRVIHLVVPAGAGGPTDVLARLVAERMSPALGQPVVIENRVGGGGAIGARVVATAEPDGYTLLFGNTATLANIPAVSRSAGYDPVRNFVAVGKVTDSYQILLVRPDAPFHSVRDLIEYAAKNPNKLNFGAVGVGNLTHLSGELLKARAHIAFVPIQYKSGAEAMTALLSGQVQFAIDNVTLVRGMIQDGRLRALAVTSATRQPDFPDLPTMIEAGVPDYVVTSFFGMVAPADTPPAIVTRLNTELNAALKTPELRASLAKLGATAATGSADDFARFIAAELQKWRAIADAADVKVD
jgi:tripartite-type tricarboxylate transporter receptor subunit TctC